VLLADPGIWACVAEAGDRIVGQIMTAMHAAAVGAAAQRGHTAMRLSVATGQERARRFFAREGWADVGAPFADPRPGLELQEMRRPVG
jgi:hypothetical protein